MANTRLLRFLVPVLVAVCGLAGHQDMFSCRSNKCPVTELTDSNWDSVLSEEPHFVMFYAPWCGHCKQLAPKLKKAAKALEGSGIKIGALDVEPNPSTQGKFPDIRGFPTLKFCPSSNAKKSVSYEGARDEDAIVNFAKAQAAKSGVVLGEAVATKAASELYTYFGRSALEGKAALLLVGKPGDGEAPGWLGKLATELRKEEAGSSGKVDPEAKTKELLREAAKATKTGSVKAAITEILGDLKTLDSKPKLGPSVVSPAYTADPSAAAAFKLEASQLPALVLASVDRKSGLGSYAALPSSKADKRGAFTPETLGFVKALLPAATKGSSAFAAAAEAEAGAKGGLQTGALPAFPKPANVLAAEERERKRKEREGGITPVTGQESLEAGCYGLSGKSCVLLAVKGGAQAADPELTALAMRFSKEGFGFAALDSSSAPPALLEAIFGDLDPDANGLAVVKGGKRPRVAATADSDLSGFLDKVVGGGASFKVIKGGLPEWPGDDAKGESEEF